MTTQEEIALALNLKLLEAASDNGADIIATACPLCQMNLEAYQNKINKTFGRKFHMPVVYFSHLLGVALGIAPEAMGIDQLLIQSEKLDCAARGARV